MKKLLRQMLIFTVVSVVGFTVAAQDKTTGGFKGKVRMENGDSVEGAIVTAKQNDREAARARSDRKGEFVLVGLKPGQYDLSFTKPGLSLGVLRNVAVPTGTIVRLSKLVMEVDQGTLAVVRGSVFDPNDRSVRGAQVEIARVSGAAAGKRIGRVFTGESGEFIFRLPSDTARYRVSVKIDGAEPASKDVTVDGAQIYPLSISLKKAED